ncbi:MAG: undecaprenyl/decaprenyl-phosphate alpha-N-acetylglucosaminyl 1-phosphate transferase [Candidatus Omnitrophica bacterium]|nr:undecaprenyl/decaprenyl-phosphate alpha-N-acetylglucosaminyl 1-phosphate transferase [Candidatus Omnitrophota bacterium]
MWKIIYIYIFSFGLIASYLIVRILKKAALNMGLVDKPDFKRKIHTKPVPLLGGLGMYLAFTLSIVFHLAIIYRLRDSVILPQTISTQLLGINSIMTQLIAILTTTFLLVLLGMIDDIKPLSARTKLIFQIILAVIVFWSGIRVTFFTSNIVFSAIFTIIWIIGITNAFNLMDNMDGLSCGTAFISTFIFFLISSTTGQFFVSSILACFGGVMLGFLIFNFAPAKVFMGDAGSMFIGYTLSLLTIINTYYRPETALTPAPVIMPLLILAIPIFDMISVIYIRLKNRVSIFTADKNHISHRLVNLGMSHKQAVLFIYLVNFCIGLGALLLGSLSKYGCFIVLLQALGILTIIILLERVKKCRC